MEASSAWLEASGIGKLCDHPDSPCAPAPRADQTVQTGMNVDMMEGLRQVTALPELAKASC